MRMPQVVGWAVLTLVLSTSVGSAADETEAVVFAVDLDGSNVHQLPDVPGYVFLGSPAMSPDGRWLAMDGWKQQGGTSSAHILFLNLESKEVRDLGPGAMPTWSADGKRVAYSSYNPRGVFIRSFEGDDVELIDERGWGIQWSPDGKSLVYTNYQQGGAQLVLYDVETKSRRGLFDENDLPYQQIYWNCDWSPDSKSIAIMGVRQDKSRDISIVTLGEEGGPVTLEYLTDAAHFHTDIGWHPHEPFLVVPQDDYVIQRINFIGSQQPVPFEGQPLEPAMTGCCWTRDGKSLILTSKVRETP